MQKDIRYIGVEKEKGFVKTRIFLNHNIAINWLQEIPIRRDQKSGDLTRYIVPVSRLETNLN